MSAVATRTLTPAAVLLLGALVVLGAGCASSGGSKTQSGTTTSASATVQGGTMAPAVEPEHIKVQHILIGFSGSVPGKSITRTKDEAKVLAYQIADRARQGEPFDGLVRTYTDDQWPGIYGMSNKGVSPAAGEYARGSMVAAFGNVGFKLNVGDIGVADYDATTSPYGYHVIKRVE